MASRNALASVAVFLLLTISGVAEGARFKVRLLNNCPYPVWPAWIPTASEPAPLCPGGTFLNVSQAYTLYPSTRWSGQFWGRTGCYFNMTTGHGKCDTGDCNGSFGCRALGASPITLAEFVPDSASTLRYHVSLLHGFNVPVRVSAHSVLSCQTLECPCDATQRCPDVLNYSVGNQKLGCFSPCDHFSNDRYCCRGNYTGAQCQPNEYSAYFKDVCKGAVTYPSDLNNTRVTCSNSADYTVTFCPDETLPTLRAAI